MSDGTPILAIADVIRLAVAPVFLLSGVGVMLTVLTNRLGRTVDRARVLEGRETAMTSQADVEDLRRQLLVLERRAHLLGRAIALCTVCALLVALVIVTLFLGAFYRFGFAGVIAGLFILAMLSFTGALLLFLQEVFIATSAMRIGLKRRAGGG
jgi:hypothetical protein